MKKKGIFWALLVFLIFIISITLGCESNTKESNLSEENKLKMINVTFEVSTPEEMHNDEVIKWTEVLLPGAYTVVEPKEMKKIGDKIWSLTIKLPEGSLVRYRYTRSDLPWDQWEHNTYNQPAYHTLYVSASLTKVFDIVAKWPDSPDVLITAEVTGRVTDKTEKPLAGLIVDAAGIRTETNYDGSFYIDEVPIGLQRITVYEPSGIYEPAVNEIDVLPDKENKISFQIEKERKPVKVKFIVNAPADNPEISTIKVVGNSGQFGNYYFQRNYQSFPSDGSQLLSLNKTKNGHWEGEVELYENMTLTYMYTLGTHAIGFEKNPDSSPVIRVISINSNNKEIIDTVTSWRGEGQTQITFNVAVPEESPVKNLTTVYLNMNGFPIIPMTKGTDNKWYLTLYEFWGDKLKYRYDRLSSYPEATEIIKKGKDVKTGYREITLKKRDITVFDKIEQWYYWPYNTEDEVNNYYDNSNLLQIDTVNGVYSEFQRGILMSDWWTPEFLEFVEPSIERVKQLNAEWFAISPVWNFSSLKPLPLLESQGIRIDSVATPRRDIITIVEKVHKNNLKVQLHLQTNPEMLPEGIELYWNLGPQTDEWWEKWFKEHERFVLYYTDLAEELNIEMLMLPNPFSGEIANFYQDNYQAQRFDEWMLDLIAEVRKRYSGLLVSQVFIGGKINYPYSYYYDVDMISNKFWYDVPTDPQVLAQKARKDIMQFKPLSEKYNKPFLIDQIAYFDAGGKKITAINEANFYEALMKAIDGQDWISGVYIFGYPYIDGLYPGPLAEGVISKWYAAWTNKN